MVNIMAKATNSNTPTIIGSREIYESDRYPLTKNQLFLKIKKGDFPKPMRVTNSFYWLRSDIERYFLKESGGA